MIYCSNPADPEEVTALRKTYIGLMNHWVENWNSNQMEEDNTL